MLILLFDGAPSVPKETQTPASIISLIGANPSICIAAAGQWETLTPDLESKPTWEWLRLAEVYSWVYIHKISALAIRVHEVNLVVIHLITSTDEHMNFCNAQIE